MKGKSTGTVRFRLDPANPPRLSAQDATRLRRRRVDTSDIPEQQGMQWSRPGALAAAENKQQITLRLDPEVVQFFRSTGKRYQSRINAVLREYVRAQERRA